MTTLCQRDPRWASVKLGFSTTSTIGNYGCLVTCLAMVGDTTPDDLNARLKAVQGFSVDLLIWSKVKEVLPFDFSPIKAYDNNAVLAEIEKNGFCLIEVDYDGKISTPNDTHFVLYLGNKQMADPWTGVIKATSYYPLVKGYSTCNKLSVPAPITVPAEITDQTKINIGGDWGILEVQAIRSMLNDNKNIVDGLTKEKGGLLEQVRVLKGHETDLATKLNCPDSIDEIMKEVNKLIASEDQLNGVTENPIDKFLTALLNLFKKKSG